MRFLFLLFICIFSLSFQTGCKKKNSKGDYGLALNDTLRVRIATEPPSLDMQKMSDNTSSYIAENIMDGLVVFDFKSAEVGLAPALATEWKSSNQAKNWEFKIREGVKWSDGQPFEPQHVVDGWERLLNPNTASNYSYFLYNIKNAKAYNEGKLKDFSQVGVKVEGNLIKVELDGAMPFPFLLTHQSTFPVRKDIISKFGDKWTEPGNIVTLGEYNLKKWEHDRALVVERNPLYWGKPSKTKNVIFYIIQEDQTAINLFDAGKIDFLRTLPSKELSHLRKRPEFVSYPYLSITYYGFNTKRAPTDNLLVRKALVHAIDRTKITTMLQGGQRPLSGWAPYGMFGHNPNVGLAFDPVRAKKYFQEAGYGESNPFPKMEISYNTNEDNKRIAENIQAQLRENLGIQAEIKNEEWKVYLETLKVNPSHFFRMGWVGDYPDPHNFFDIMLSYADNNHTGWENLEYDKLIEQAVTFVEDKAKRLEMYNKAHKILVEEDVPVFPIFTAVAHNLVSPRVVGMPKNVMFIFPLKNVSLQ